MIKVLILLLIIGGLVFSAPMAYQKYCVWDASNPADDDSSVDQFLIALTPKVQASTIWQSIDFNLGTPVIDVRTQQDYDKGHIPNAVLIPETQINEKFSKIYPEKNITVYVYADGPYQGAVSARLIRNLGYSAFFLDYGFKSWLKAGFKTQITNPLYF